MNPKISPAKLFFASDYMEGAHPLILKRLMETNLVHSAGYGTDEAMRLTPISIFWSAAPRLTPP